MFGGWTFNSGASAYTFTNNQALTFNGVGIIGGSPAITNTLVGFLNFTGNSTAGNASITDNGTLNFKLNSTAGNATINNNDNMHFLDNSTAGNAAITNGSGALTDFSFSTGPTGDNKLTAGSIAGAGVFQLGANELTVGGNNFSTEVSGAIVGTGSLVKVGTGTLTLSGNANLGGTTIDGGTLAVNGGALNAINTIILGSTAGTSGTLNIGAGGRATAQNLIVGESGVGILAVQNGGILTDFGGFVGDLPGSQGTVTVSGAGSTWTNTDTIQVGGLGTGTLTIETAAW